MNGAPGQKGKRDFSHAWRALKHRNFRLYFAGQGVSLMGNWMTKVATGWLVYRLTRSPVTLGTVGFAGQIPTFLLAPMAGVLVDRWDRRTVLVWTQTVSMLQSLALAVLTLMGIINIPEVIALSVVQGVVNAFDVPGRQSFLSEMVGSKEDLSNAIAINSSMVNMARLVGPAVAGLVIAATNEGWCFGLDGLSYVAVIVSLLMMRLTLAKKEKATTSMLEQWREGWRYVSGFMPIRTISLLFAVLSLMGYPFMVLMPVFAAKVLHGGPHTLGFLMGACGVGSLVSALMLVVRKSVRGLTTMIPIAGAVFGVGLIAFGLSGVLWVSMVMITVAGWGMMQALTASNTVIQTLVDQKMRGRVMSFYTMAFMGMAPFGSLLAGALAHAIGAQRTVMVTGSFCILGAVWFAGRLKGIRVVMRPIYEAMGIVAGGQSLRG